MKRLVCLGVMLTLVLGCFTTVSFAASSKTKKMTAYTECVKSGNYVYCNTPSGIYKINIKNNKKSRIAKVGYPSYEGFAGMKLKNGYIYYSYVGMEGEMALYRVKTNGKSRKELASFYDGYEDGPQFAISGKKIYYKGYSNYGCTKKFKKKMKLNGKSKSKSSYNVKTKYAKTNKSGYRVVNKGNDETTKYYLRKPNGKKVYITTVTWDE